MGAPKGAQETGANPPQRFSAIQAGSLMQGPNDEVPGNLGRPSSAGTALCEAREPCSAEWNLDQAQSRKEP